MNQTKKILLIMTSAAFVAAGAYVFMFWQVRSASKKVAEAEQVIQGELEKQGKEDSIRNLFTQTEEEREELFTRVIRKGDLVGFFEELEVLADEAGVDMNIARIEEGIELDQVVPERSTEEGSEKPKPRDHPAAKQLEWIQMDIEAEGTWESTYRFLSFVELLPYHVILSNVRIAQVQSTESLDAEGGRPADNWRLTLTAKMLRQKQE